MVVLAVIGVLLVAALTLAHRPSSPVVSAGVNTQPKVVEQPVHVVAVQTEAPPKPLVVSLPTTAIARARLPKPVVEKPKPQSPARTLSVSSDAGEPAPAAVALESATSASVAEPTAKSNAVEEAFVTIAGCLETTVDGDEFRLTDTEGADAPKARSWRSGFMKKRSTPVQLLEISDPLALRRSVGHRVVATGLLTSRELRVRSLQSPGPSCN